MPVVRPKHSKARVVTLFLCGDVMTGRGIDQILPNSNEPWLLEPAMDSALEYVASAESFTGPLPRRASFNYIWGDALAELECVRPAARIIKLETAVTASPEAWPQKEIDYRMDPANVPSLQAAGIDCCVLANNHVLDWGRSGLEETFRTLHGAGIRTAGAGSNETEAAAPAILDVSGERQHSSDPGLPAIKNRGRSPESGGLLLAPRLAHAFQD